jgi:sugar phosphate isomerase/epimerase
MDLAWIVRGGTDPGAWIAAEGRRVTAAWIKDIAPADQNGDEDSWADLGHGTVDWPMLMPARRGRGALYSGT